MHRLNHNLRTETQTNKRANEQAMRIARTIACVAIARVATTALATNSVLHSVPHRPCLVDPSNRSSRTRATLATDGSGIRGGNERRAMGLPRALDYRLSHGVVSPAKEQGDCGSCWAFSATEAMEGQIGLDGRPRVLAPQTFVDCVRADWGCLGGWPDDALAYSEEHGVAAESDYPYQGNESGVCKMNLDDAYERVAVAARADVFYELRAHGSDAELRAGLWQYGPLSVAIDASSLFEAYTGGVLNDTECATRYPNHAVLLVGYSGTNGSADDYWIIKNSWGKSWGEEGFIRLSASTPNACAVGLYATVPSVSSVSSNGSPEPAARRHMRHQAAVPLN
jgi:C1A family cysteine protease